ncbi:UMP-CMP kinase [Colletotrichum scovillei]|uniref:Uridylate kinase n=2 Tax=Colletotrichum acutatum species complex TaxID=2707335 RepID=A0A9P7R5K7_9PEZI|nr:UMP-CMP kinase [Colletotrichum scovillei]KXH42571.1 UMP-CMP kinase [Colletotrichum nymphaeae SA-01]KAF4781701.1 UMP-CMP kinase [Colletotrichum scovillei]KAG7050623.1 uridylate kinase [Colletotrichum scovillei]KAG7069667.1 uridylate kinase [Colletotrichum scovillei]KAG7073543.1 uridylate kinase [Colletotrichum scovillei]
MHSFAPRLLSRASSSPIRSSNILTSTSRSSLRLQQRLPAHRFYSSEPPKKSSGVKFWPFLVVVGAGSFAYKLLVDQRAEMASLPAPEAKQGLPAPTKSTPTFSPADVTVLFVLGGPGAGKGTQCARLVSDYGFTHLSAGDLLRAEQDRPGSQFGQLIKDYIKDGLIVPMEVTVQLLENAMTETIKNNPGSKARFLIDGFPRKMDQAVKFEEAVCPAKLVLFYDCPEDVMESRLLERGKTSGRADDNAESIRKRFRTFVETSMPVVDYFEKEGRVVKLDATPSPQDVYSKTRSELSKRLGI